MARRLGFFVPLTEAEWLACSDADPLVRYLSGIDREPKSRKLRLFACACCRRSFRAFTEEARQAVEIAEQAADGSADRNALARASRRAISEAGISNGPSHSLDPARYHAALASGAASQVAAPTTFTWGETWRAIAPAAGAMASFAGPTNSPQFQTALAAERAAQADLFRHIVGNPFRDPPKADRWPSSVVSLARAMYAGELAHAPLHDALLEAEHAELAEHFHDSAEWHPRGCWALDLILGKQR